jgi:LysR family transcriptional repressor of citA
MNMQWLETFLMAGRTENFRETSEKMHLAQPTVSLQVQKLEEHLGVKLFERVGKHVRLSGMGRHFYKHAEEIVASYRQSRDEMERLRQGYSAMIRIAVSPLIATTVLPVWVKQFTEQYASVEFSIQVLESVDILPSVLSQDVDMGLSRLDVTHSEIETLCLYADPVIMVGPSSSGDIDGTIATIDEAMSAYPVLTHNHPEYWEGLLHDLVQKYGYVRTMKVSQVHVTKQWVIEGLGTSFLPVSTVRRELLRGTIQEVFSPFISLPQAHTYMLRPKFAQSEMVKTFMEYIVMYMKLRSFDTNKRLT